MEPELSNCRFATESALTLIVMKNIVVSAGSLRMGGAVTIYNQFLSHLREEIGDNRYFIFVNKVLQQPAIPGVRYYEIDIESRKRRNWFDNTGCEEILEEEGFIPDVVVSLQNTGIRSYVNISQLVYYHQPLPFFKHNWNPLKKEERSKFLYKHFYLWFVKRTIGPKTRFVVQTEFIKDNLVKRLAIDESRVSICFPDVEVPDADKVQGYSFPKDEVSLIFPSLYSPHKSHATIVKAIGVLKRNNEELLRDVRIYFTVGYEEAPELVSLIKALGVEDEFCLMGRLSYETTLSLYKSADAMLFPSTMETLGLPLVEASAFGLPILVADVPYAHEVMYGYDGVRFVKPEEEKEWAIEIEKIIKDRVKYGVFKSKGKRGWHEFFELI